MYLERTPWYFKNRVLHTNNAIKYIYQLSIITKFALSRTRTVQQHNVAGYQIYSIQSCCFSKTCVMKSYHHKPAAGDCQRINNHKYVTNARIACVCERGFHFHKVPITLVNALVMSKQSCQDARAVVIVTDLSSCHI